MELNQVGLSSCRVIARWRGFPSHRPGTQFARAFNPVLQTEIRAHSKMALDRWHLPQAVYRKNIKIGVKVQ